jgi:hypothetical protein
MRRWQVIFGKVAHERVGAGSQTSLVEIRAILPFAKCTKDGAPSHHMPPQTTQQSHRPRVSDRTMVGHRQPPACTRTKSRTEERESQMAPKTSNKCEKENHALEISVAAAGRGWMSEKPSPLPDRVKCLFLTSPFIEPATVLIKRKPLKMITHSISTNPHRSRERWVKHA